MRVCLCIHWGEWKKEKDAAVLAGWCHVSEIHHRTILLRRSSTTTKSILSHLPWSREWTHPFWWCSQPEQFQVFGCGCDTSKKGGREIKRGGTLMNQRPQCSNIAVANSANYCDAGTLLLETSVSQVQFSWFSSVIQPELFGCPQWERKREKQNENEQSVIRRK